MTEYTVTIPGFSLWPTGRIKGSANRTVKVTEERSVLGGMRAIDKAYEQVGGAFGWVAADFSPAISPNPALEGWPIGEAR